MQHRRQQSWSSPRIAQHHHPPVSTVVTAPPAHGAQPAAAPRAPHPVIRFEAPTPVALVHLDVKKLGRIGRVEHRIASDRTTRVRRIGGEYVPVAADDCVRLVYADERDRGHVRSTTAQIRESIRIP